MKLLENDVQGAREVADDAMAAAPFHPAVWFANGEVFRREKHDDKALEAYAKAVEYDASYSAARLAYAEALAKKGGDALPKALAQYQALLAIDQNDGETSRVEKTITALKKQLAQ